MSSEARVVLVTGGAVRLGRAVVEGFAARGWRVAFTYRGSGRQAADLEAALRASSTDAVAYGLDLQDREARSGLPLRIRDRFGRLDAVVNNAAVFPRTPVEGLTEDTFRAVLATNLEAPVFLTLGCAAMLRESRGAVVNIADIYGIHPLRDHLAYSISKAGLIAATRALAVELAPEARVNAVAPGIALFPEGYPEDVRARLLAKTLLAREGGADEIAAAVVYLVESTTTMTGQLLVLDGGRTVAL